MSAKAIRQSFVDYFVQEHDHTFVRSSPVIPLCDPTVAFVNAGMNQVLQILSVKFIVTRVQQIWCPCPIVLYCIL